MRIILAKGSEDDFFFWNIDANVGLNSPNKLEDVQLVQFGYFAWSVHPAWYYLPPDLRPIFAAVTPGAIYNGARNDPLTLAILAHQKSHGGTQDGHVSVMKGSLTYAHHPTPGGRESFMLADLTPYMVALMPNDFPRIDKHPKCPPLLRRGVMRALGNGR